MQSNKTEKMKENISEKTFSRTTTEKTREVGQKIPHLENLLEQKIHYVSVPGPQMQLGKLPRDGWNSRI